MIGIIIDVAIIVIIALCLLVGVKRGFVKTIKGFISAILILILTIVTVTPLTNLLITATEWDNQLAGTLETALADKVPNAYANIYYYDLDENGEDELIFEINNQKKDFSTIFDDSALKFLGLAKIIKPTVESKIDIEDEGASIYLIDVLTETLTQYILIAIMFAVLGILYKIAFVILFKVLDKLAKELYVMHFVDKTLGAIMGLLLGCVVALVAITVVQFAAPLSFMAPVNTYIEQTSVVKFVMDNNFLYTFIQQNLNLNSLRSIIPI
jgi:uncharacterized membrane protein required for colicin V production